MKEFSYSCSGIPFLRFGSGEPLVFIHGLGEVKEGWNNQYDFADQYDLIIPDLRGHGEHMTTGEISIPHFASDVICLLKVLGIESAHICGLSMGGMVAQEIYRQAPEICRSLILVSTFHFVPKKLGNIYLKLRKVRGQASFGNAKKKDMAARISLHSWNKKISQEFYQFYQPNHDFFLKSVEACLKVNNLKLLPRINVSTLIVGGQYDSVIPVWIQLLMHKKIRNSEFIIFRNAGHLTKLEAKESFNRVLRNFLNKQRAAS